MTKRRLLETALSAGVTTTLAYAGFVVVAGAWGWLAAAGLAGVSAVALSAFFQREKAPSAPEARVLEPPVSREIDGEFIGRVSHEIRTPLNGILGLTQVLLGGKSSPEQRELLEMIKASGESLLRIINDLLDYSKIQAGKIRIEPEEFHLGRFVRQSVRTLAPQAHLKGVELAFWVAPDVPDVVFGDPLRIRQVVANLIVNAIKFTPRGDVLVEVTAEPRAVADGRARVRFSVKDTGIGVARESIDKIFGAFVQGGNAPSEHGGLGLGLAISSELVERMGGVLSVASEEGKGSEFSFDVLFEKARSAREAEAPEGLRGKRALVVDDSSVQLDVMTRHLALLGVEAECAESPEAALRAVASAVDEGREFSLLFLDSHMPGVDVWALARELRRRSEFPGVLMTLAHEQVEPERLRSLGILGHLTKPIAPAHLLRAIEILERGASVPKPEDIQTQGMDRPLFAGLKILLAEDHPVNRTVVVRSLESGGSRVVAVENGKEALERWSKEPFDVLVLDLEMPEVDGLAVARRIREREKETGSHQVIVALTAHSREEVRERCLSAGMDDFLSKPFVASELAAAIRMVSKRPQRTGTVFDRKEALGRANGDPTLLAELIELFHRETPASVSSLASALEAGDLASVERHAHRLKGALLTLSARSGAAVALELETSANRRDRAACQTALSRLRQELPRLEAELRSAATPVSSRP